MNPETDRHRKILEEEVLVLDGAMGTMIQRLHPTEEDFRGERFAGHKMRLSGCNDILCLTRPEAIKDIHRAYLEAGADIITTNSFNANAISLADYALHEIPGFIKELNRAAASIARSAADEALPRRNGRTALVAGSMGPTNRTASMSGNVEDPAARSVAYDQLFDAYLDQAIGLNEGGVDMLLFETVFDTLNLKAGLDAASRAMEIAGRRVPVMVSATISDRAGRTLSGQTLKAFVTSIENYDNILSIGLNCGFGAADMTPYLRELGHCSPHFVSAHPNAGLPNELGEYDETPESFALHMATMLREGLLNIAGGCCGTTPEHIAALAGEIESAVVHRPAKIRPALRISGLEMVEVLPENNFLNVGERCNVAGSRKFLRLIKERKYEEAATIAHKQVEDGAMVIDVNMDDAMLDAREEMVHFLRYIASDPDIAKVPVMIDSSDWAVVEAGLKNLQGKSIVNSISLKEGEEQFLRKARRIRELGAAVIVMAFDEKGQADTFERKIEIAGRAYRLLIDKCGFKADDIIFDVNIMAVATGIEEHNRYGIDYIRAVEWIKNNLPGARTSGGVSNLSFAFRGKNALREAMHSVFLYHAIAAGLDMGIVNPSSSTIYEDIPLPLRRLLEDVILARRDGAAEELAEYAASAESGSAKSEVESLPEEQLPAHERLVKGIVKGNFEKMPEALAEALEEYGSAVKVIEGPLMEGMNHVGNLFGEGKMFLPQVVKTARTMKQAVDFLRPYMEKEKSESAPTKEGKVVFATVKGDVHDIGKNIVGIVLGCNNYEVIDLGVMVPAEKIVETVKRERPDLVCLSGLITPSLSEMVNVVKALKAEGIDIPVMVGGATTSRLHTAVKIAPEYEGIVVHTTDAAQNSLVAARLLNPATSGEYIKSLRKEYAALAEDHRRKNRRLLPLDEARTRGGRDVSTSPAPKTPVGMTVEIPLSLKEIIPLINWKMFFHAWRVNGSLAEEEAKRLQSEAMDFLVSIGDRFDGKGAVRFFKASKEGDDLILATDGEHTLHLPMLRQQEEGSDFLSLVDFISKEDYVGVFAATAGKWLAEECERLKVEGDSYKSLLVQTLSDRIAEAASEWMHKEVRRRYWGYAESEKLTDSEILKGAYEGIRPAVGYPMIPEQLLNKEIGALLPLEEMGVTLTENGAMSPSATVSGLYLASPESRYFLVGDIDADQVKDYALRRGMEEERIKEILRL